MIGPLSYIGGKNRLSRIIISKIPEHTAYIEPFCGGAQVFFHKEPSKVEVLNDLNEDVFNFLRTCKLHHTELVRQLEFCIAGRKWFELFQDNNARGLSDIQRAARFFYLQKNCYAGLVKRQNYTISVADGSNYNPRRIPEQLQKAHERLLNVQLECLPYQQILKRYDRPDTFFYLDPPYFNLRYYRYNLEENDFVEMAGLLANIRGKFLLSLNDTAEVRQIFSAFRIEGLSLYYSSQQKKEKRYQEVFISNYDLPLLKKE